MSRNRYFTNKGSTPVLTPGGPVALIDLDNRQQNIKINLVIEGELDVTVATTGTVNRGLPSAMFQFSIYENGGPVYGRPAAEGRMLRAYAESRAGAPLPADAIASGALGAATYAFRESFPIYFANPLAAKPRETTYIERNPNSRFQLAVTLKPNALRCLVTGGTATLENVTVTAYQDADPAEAGLPLFKPEWREIVQDQPAANAATVFRLDTPYRVPMLLFSAEADKADGGTVEVADVITALQLLGDGGKYLFGPNDIAFADLVDMNAQLFGGDVGGTSGAYAVLDFQRAGRLSDVPFPGMEFSNFRAQLNAQPTAGAGLVNSRVRVAMIELTRPDPLGGWNVVQPPPVPAFLTI